MNESTEITRREVDSQALAVTDGPTGASRQLNYGYGTESAEGEVHLLDYWRAIRKRLWLVIGVTALLTTLATIYVARKPDIYESWSRVQVDLENNPMYATGKNTPYIYSPVNDPAYFNTQLQILTSPGLLRRVAKTLDLEHNDAFSRPQSARQQSTFKVIAGMIGFGSKSKTGNDRPPDVLPTSSTIAPESAGYDAVEAKRLAPYVGGLQAGLTVEPVRESRAGYYKDTRLIDIRYQHGDPEIAAKITNCIVQTFVHANLEKRNETNSTASEFLSKRVADLQTQIRSDEEKLVEYAKNNQILSLDASQNTVVERLAGLNKNLLEAENDRKLAEAEYNAAKAPGAAAALAETASKDANDTELKIADLKQERAKLLVDATEEAPEVKEKDNQIAALETHLKDMRARNAGTLMTVLETKYKQAEAREAALRTAFNQQKGETVTQNEAAINYRILQQQIDTNRDLLNSMLQRSKENDVVVAGRPNNISIVDYAIANDNPVAPSRGRSVIIAFVLAAGLGVGLALFLEYLDDTVHSTDDVERFLRLPALAVIPAMATGAGPRRLLSTANSLQKRNGSNGAGNPELLLNVTGRSPLAESYRQLRTSVLLSTAGRAPKTLLITSSLPGEGKTTTAVNTAISLAQTGAKVVIIDADMRRPRLRSIFDLAERQGLSSILSSEMSEADILKLISTEETTGLNILTSGPVPPNPAELIGSEQMRRLITVLSKSFTHIVVDSPPITSFTDGVLIASMVDGVLLVVHGGKSSRSVVRRSRQLLLDVGAKVFGVVLNNVNVRSHDYYYYYQRYYHQNYYNTDVEEEPAQGRAASA